MATDLDQHTTRIPLGPLDHIAPSNIPQSIIYLSLKPHVSPRDAFSCLHAGLRQTLLQAPWLTGRVYRQSQETPGWRPGQLEIRYDSRKESSSLLRMKELDTSISFADVRDTGFPLDAFNDETLLWTSPFETDFESGVDVFAAQVNFVPGGCLLVLSIAPAASDGTAMLTVTKLWADHCANNLNQREISSAPWLPLTFDRTVLDTVWKDGANPPTAVDDKRVALCHLVGLDGLDSVRNDHQEYNDTMTMKPSIFYMPHTAYTALRKGCTAEAGRVDVSGNDLICALIWRSIIRAWVDITTRHDNIPKVATLAVPFDARSELTQSLKASFLGNLNFENKLTLPLDTLIANSTTVPWVAREIRANAADHAHKAALTSAYNLLQNAPKYSVHDTQIRASRMLPASASVGILSPMVLPFNDTCFGRDVFGNDGKPEGFRPLMGACNRGYRTCFVIPRKQHGGIEFVMTLSEQEMEFLREDEEFSRYAFPLS